MKSKNICKFISDTDAERLTTHNFVLESNTETMQKKDKLSHNRAVLVVSGHCIFDLVGSSFPVRKGTLIFTFAGEEASVREIGEKTEYIYVSFDGGRADELFHRFDIHPSRRTFDGFEGVIPFWQENISRAAEDCVDLISESVLMYTFSRLKSVKNQSDDIVNKAIRMIESDFRSPDLSLSYIADKLGYNVKYLSHSFKEKMGVGFSQYLRTVRIKHAVFLMEHGVESVKNIAFLCGFSDPLYFSTVFKEALGISPKEYMTELDGKSLEKN